MQLSDHIAQHWSPSTITLSYLISVTGSFCTIQLMEQWRQHESEGTKKALMWLSALTLGGCGIWCTHFTGMNALDLVLDDGTLLEIHFEFGLTFFSFVFPVLGVFFGLKVASADPFFLEIEQSRRKEILVRDLSRMKMKHVVNKSQISRQLKVTALFSRLWRILGGGLLAAIGVLGMHYVGMLAQRTNAIMELDGRVVLVSCAVAFVTANAAFWILFRAHTFWPDNESLRFASALIMGVAVCGTHYSGMASANYIHTEENFILSARYSIDGAKTAVAASHASILLCYWLTSLCVTRSVKITEGLTRSRSEEAAQQRTIGNHSTRAETQARLTRGRTATKPIMTMTSRQKVYAAPAEDVLPEEPLADEELGVDTTTSHA